MSARQDDSEHSGRRRVHEVERDVIPLAPLIERHIPKLSLDPIPPFFRLTDGDPQQITPLPTAVTKDDPSGVVALVVGLRERQEPLDEVRSLDLHG
jgi:hypothetical protein